jgi:two-component SAPR family response regulator
MSKKLLLVSKLSDAKTFLPYFPGLGIEVERFEKFDEALEKAKEWQPQLIIFLLPIYWESIIDFVEEVHNDPNLSNTKMLYLGKLVEGADLASLQRYKVKTMPIGPVPTEEIVRFIDKLFD